jgi:hypothetical protein
MSSIAFAAAAGVAAAMAVSGCGAVNRTRPGDMTVPEHEQAAQSERRKAEESAERATSVGRGSEYERYSARRHRELAEAHAGAADRRRAEVGRACDGADVTSPLASMLVQRVEPIREGDVPPELRTSRGYYPDRLRGARMAVATPQGVAPDAAARSLRCEAARASAGLDQADGRSPLTVATSRTSVRVVDSGLVVEIRSPRQEDAAEILRRADPVAAAPAGSH